MSPEQARGTGVDYRTDVYALGIVMFEILAGARPFPVLADSFATLLQHSEEPPMSLADVVTGLPAEMTQLVDAMLAKTPQARPSLAAVRTVIKRLRTTQLPTRSIAGQALASFSQTGQSGSRADVTPSQLGAQPLLPGLPEGLQRLAIGAGPATGEKPDITTRGVGVGPLLAQFGLPQFAPNHPRPMRPTPSPPVGVPTGLPHSVGTRSEPQLPVHRISANHEARPPATGSQPLQVTGARSRGPATYPPPIGNAMTGQTGLTGLTSPNGVMGTGVGVAQNGRGLPTTLLGHAAPVVNRDLPVPELEPAGNRRWWVALAALIAAAIAIAAVIALSGP
jgi:serine/threonine-protein kinase